MTRQQLQLVETMTRNGIKQGEIARVFGMHRNAIYDAQKKLGLTARRFPTPEQEKEILKLLRSGKGVRKAGAATGFREGMVRMVARKHGFRRKSGERGCRYKLTAAQRERISQDILRRADYLNNLALKHNVGHKMVIKLAHELLGVERFRSGRSVEPLTSDEPLNPQTIANIAEKIILMFDGQPPRHPVIIAAVVTATMAKKAEAEGVKFYEAGVRNFAEKLANELRRRIGDAELPAASGALVN